MIYYLPLEHLEMRYTTHLDRDIKEYLISNQINHIVVEPEKVSEINNGSFLDSGTTIMTKSKQINYLASLYRDGKINNGDIIFTTDLWFPGIESIAYLNYFYKKEVKIRGVIHAGSFTDTDFVRDMERWAKYFEDIVFDISDKVFVASKFIAEDIYKKRIIDSNKLIVSGLPLDFNELNKYKTDKTKENIIVFNGRNVDEKQPWLFEELIRTYPDYTFVNTHKLNLPKKEYYELLSKSKVIVSFALQENFGYGIQEAVYLGCVPIVPNRLVYKEQFDSIYRYNILEECKIKVKQAINGELIAPEPLLLNNTSIFKTWFYENN
jgi:hypothetical protein